MQLTRCTTQIKAAQADATTTKTIFLRHQETFNRLYNNIRDVQDGLLVYEEDDEDHEHMGEEQDSWLEDKLITGDLLNERVQQIKDASSTGSLQQD